MPKRSTRVLGAALVAVTLTWCTGCGGNDDVVVRSPTATTSTSTPGTSTAPSTPTPSTLGTRGARPRTTVTPHAGLRDGQAVRVTASGFSPGLSLIVVECAQKGAATGPGDCDLAGSATVQTGADGRASTMLHVRRGPFGSNKVICSRSQPCLVSVTQAALDPTEEADATITFG